MIPTFALDVVAELSKVLSAVPWPLMVWSTLAFDTYQLRFVSWVFHVISSFVHFISLYTLGSLCDFRKPLPYNMHLFNLRITNHILIKIEKILHLSDTCKWHLADMQPISDTWPICLFIQQITVESATKTTYLDQKPVSSAHISQIPL